MTQLKKKSGGLYVMQIVKTHGFGSPTPFWTSYFRKWGQKTFKRYLKSEQTDRRTHGRTFQLIEGAVAKTKFLKFRSVVVNYIGIESLSQQKLRCQTPSTC